MCNLPSRSFDECVKDRVMQEVQQRLDNIKAELLEEIRLGEDEGLRAAVKRCDGGGR
jgi:hypothetical protein